MNGRILYSAVLITASMLLFFSLIGTDNPDRKFLIVSMHSGIDTSSVNYSRMKDSLGMNGWHRYNQWFTSDDINNPDTSDIFNRVKYRVEQNNARNLRTIFGRRITDYCAWGQRSDYQCEKISTGQPYWFYSYNTSDTNSRIHDISDSGQTVKYCQADTSSPGSGAGYIVKGLRANREQANRFWSPWQSDSMSTWYVKPRIRIPTGLSSNTPVCRIEVLNWDSNMVRSVDIFAGNFRSSINPYNGNYMDEFYFAPDVVSSIKIDSFQLCPGPYSLRKKFWDWASDSSINTIKTDFRIYWYGQCDMWIDRIRVENDQAVQLFSSDKKRDNQIRSEVRAALTGYDVINPVPNNFYLEEFEFNTTPCIKKVREIIEDESQGKLTLIANLNMDLYNVVVPNYDAHRFTTEDFERYFVDSSGVKKIATTNYFLEGWDVTGKGSNRLSKNPNTLPVYQQFPSADYNPGKGLLTHKTTPSDYDNWLQYNFDDNPNFVFNFTNLLKINDEISKSRGVDYFSLHQSYMWFLPTYKLKEPTNEETELTGNLAISYGAKGLMYFSYDGNVTDNGFSSNYGNNGTEFFHTGFLDDNLEPRYYNAYGQNRWEFYKKYNRILEKWSPYLMSFDNTSRKSFIYRNPAERADMNNYTFIRDMSSFPADPLYYPIPDPDVLNLETNNNTYLQASCFQKQNETGQNKYFMIINRRCSPFVNYNTADNIGGKRFVFMRVNSTNLQGFNNWKIIDLKTGDSVLTFNNNDTAKNLYLGEYDPGEGRLYRVAPVMQEGGTLVTNEQVEGITFVCNGPVNNNGKDISILEGTKINFKTGAGINMTGGKLTCSNYSTNTSENVLLKGYNGPWNGIVMNNCMRSVIQRTRFEDAKNCIVISNDNGVSKYTAKVIRRNYFKVSADSGKALTINNQMEMAIDSNTFHRLCNL